MGRGEEWEETEGEDVAVVGVVEMGCGRELLGEGVILGLRGGTGKAATRDDREVRLGRRSSVCERSRHCSSSESLPSQPALYVDIAEVLRVGVESAEFHVIGAARR